jgi:hypothetical protein
MEKFHHSDIGGFCARSLCEQRRNAIFIILMIIAHKFFNCLDGDERNQLEQISLSELNALAACTRFSAFFSV